MEKIQENVCKPACSYLMFLDKKTTSKHMFACIFSI